MHRRVRRAGVREPILPSRAGAEEIEVSTIFLKTPLADAAGDPELRGGEVEHRKTVGGRDQLETGAPGH